MVKEHVLDNDYDAIIGLAYPAMANLGLPVFDSMIQQGLLKKNRFSFFLGDNKTESSVLMFGYYNKSKKVGKVKWHSVVQ